MRIYYATCFFYRLFAFWTFFSHYCLNLTEQRRQRRQWWWYKKKKFLKKTKYLSSSYRYRAEWMCVKWNYYWFLWVEALSVLNDHQSRIYERQYYSSSIQRLFVSHPLLCHSSVVNLLILNGFADNRCCKISLSTTLDLHSKQHRCLWKMWFLLFTWYIFQASFNGCVD